MAGVRSLHSVMFAPFVECAYDDQSLRQICSVKRSIANDRPLMRTRVEADDSITFRFMRLLTAKREGQGNRRQSDEGFSRSTFRLIHGDLASIGIIHVLDLVLRREFTINILLASLQVSWVPINVRPDSPRPDCRDSECAAMFPLSMHCYATLISSSRSG
jgi:hypothetical protein